MSKNFLKYTSIGKLSDVYHHMKKIGSPVVSYGAKVKLHGTNACVRIDSDGTVTAQKRTSDITPDDDNCGFAAWVEEHKESWSVHASEETTYVYGEWAGKGVRRGDAVCQLDGKYFFIFCVVLTYTHSETNELKEVVINEPEGIEGHFPDLDNILVMPWHSQYVVDFSKHEQVVGLSKVLEKQVNEIGQCDPFIKEIFGIEGVGEGLVLSAKPEFVSAGPNLVTVEGNKYRETIFKVKSDHHKVNNTKKKAPVLVEVPQEVSGFIQMFVTDARMQQMLDEVCGGVSVPNMTGPFLKAVNQDIIKESELELEKSDLTWKDVSKHVSNKAIEWFKSKQDEVI